MHPAQAMPQHEAMDLLVLVRKPKRQLFIASKPEERSRQFREYHKSKPAVKCQIIGEICSSGKQHAQLHPAINRSTARLRHRIRWRRIPKKRKENKRKASTSIRAA
jgi:hypothetical protein